MTVIFWQFDSSPLPSNFRCSSRPSFQILSKFSFFSACFYHVTCVFIVNLLSTIVWMSSNSFLETGTVSEIYMTTTGFEPITTLTKWSSVRLRPEWLWVAIPLQSLKCPGQIVKNFSPQSICVSAFKPAPILCVCNYLNPYYERQTMYLFQLILQYDFSLWVIHISVIQSSLWLWNRK